MRTLFTSWGNTKPPFGTQLDLGHPSTKNLRLALTFNSEPAIPTDGGRIANYGLWPVGGYSFAAQNAYTPIIIAGTTLTRPARKAGGTRLVLDTTATRVSCGPNEMVPTSGGFTVLMGYQKTDTTARTAFGFDSSQDTSAETTAYCAALVRYTGLGTQFYYGGVVEGTTLLTFASPLGTADSNDVWGFTTGTRGMEIWQNGVLRASNAANPSRTDNAGNFYIGAPGGADNDLRIMDFFYLWNRQLTPTEIARISAFPFDVFMPQPRFANIGAVTAVFTGGNFLSFH